MSFVNVNYNGYRLTSNIFRCGKCKKLYFLSEIIYCLKLDLYACYKCCSKCYYYLRSVRESYFK